MASPNNYLVDTNRFKLAGPPQWWLRQLWDFDPSLVVVPSRQGFYYRLAQRRQLQLPEHIVNEALFKESDTQMLATYNLVPVTTILATANWSNPYLFVELGNRAPWRLGGADKVNNELEAREREEKQRLFEKNDDRLTRLSKDAWRLYRTKIGLGRSWNITPEASKTPIKRVAKRIDRSTYYPGFGGGL